MMKPIAEDYTVAVVNPHLKSVVRDIKSRAQTSTKRLFVYVYMTAADHARGTASPGGASSLEVLISRLVDRLIVGRGFGFRCRVLFKVEGGN
ncbi:MAG: hypothetical protein GY719_39285 [bacterium]|nr:hypothetical protein [bacterium]